MNEQKLTFRMRDPGPGQSFEALLEGVPGGVTIDEGYVGHQLWRVRRVLAGPTPKREPESVTIAHGVRRGKTTGTPLALSISAQGLGPRATQPLVRGHPWTLESIATELGALTVVRKLLEDRQLFVGSRVLGGASRAWASREEEALGRFLGASCGAYKITEQADLSPSRVLLPGRRGTRPGQRSRTARAFELLVSGPLGWTRRAGRSKRALLKALAARILVNDLVESVSAVESAAGTVEVLRLCGVVKPQPVRVVRRSASLVSVLSETMVLPELAASIGRWRIAGLSEAGPFGSPPLG